jgi:hypothetical protein
LSYCLEDGAALVTDRFGSSDLPATLIIPEPRPTAQQKQETFRPSPASPQPYTAPPPAWSPVGVAQISPVAPARQGRGVALASLICAIAAFVLLGFCIVAGANGVESTLIGGIFLFSALSALVGAVLGIVATSKCSNDVSAQNAKTMSIVALALNCFYLLITALFLILGAINSSQ